MKKSKVSKAVDKGIARLEHQEATHPLLRTWTGLNAALPKMKDLGQLNALLAREKAEYPTRKMFAKRIQSRINRVQFGLGRGTAKKKKTPAK